MAIVRDGTLFTESCCHRGDVRLKSEGLVEVCGSIGSKKQSLVWKSVCTTGWDEHEARVVCRQLGYEGQNSLFLKHHNILGCMLLDSI